MVAAAEPPGAPGEVNVFLVSHTNAGKTSLARTLLGRDVGIVRDEAHVTDRAEPYEMLTAEGARLVLWDTPGFGDSVRLLRRLRQSGNPIGWLLAQVWDRYRDRPFWCSQQAVRAVRDQADVVLYLVNAAEDPDYAGYVEPELHILAWTGRPVLVLLNQTGEPRPAPEEEAEAARWRAFVGGHGAVRGVLTLDAFSRCWVQEAVLAKAIGPLLPAERAAAWAVLADAWAARGSRTFSESMRLLAAELARAATDEEAVTGLGWKERSRDWLGRLAGRTGAGAGGARERAMQALAARRAGDSAETTARLIAAHGLAGRAPSEVLARLAGDFDCAEPVNEGYAALLGGVLTGALGGLKADLASGGLTLGAGTVLGGVLGALGGLGLARGYNLVRGAEEPRLRWSPAFLDGLVQGALLRYIAVAHYGRGRGEFVAGAPPGFWRETVAQVLAGHRATLQQLWDAAEDRAEAGALAEALEAVLEEAGLGVLARLYPEAFAGGAQAPVCDGAQAPGYSGTQAPGYGGAQVPE